MQASHEQFEREQGGKVFVVFSVSEKGGTKRIFNPEIVDEILAEMKRLSEI